MNVFGPLKQRKNVEFQFKNHKKIKIVLAGKTKIAFVF